MDNMRKLNDLRDEYRKDVAESIEAITSAVEIYQRAKQQLSAFMEQYTLFTQNEAQPAVSIRASAAEGVECKKCHKIVKNNAGLAAHMRSHRRKG